MATTATVRDAGSSQALRMPVEEFGAHLSTLEQELSDGRSIELTRADKVVAVVRAGTTEAVSAKVRPPLPDFMARMTAIFGDELLETDGATIIREDRDARG